MDLIATLEARRKEAGLKRAEFARSLGITRDYYQKLVNGTRPPNWNFLAKLRAAYPDIYQVAIEEQISGANKEAVA